MPGYVHFIFVYFVQPNAARVKENSKMRCPSNSEAGIVSF